MIGLFRYSAAIAAATAAMLFVTIVGAIGHGQATPGGWLTIGWIVGGSIIATPVIAMVVAVVAAPASIVVLWGMRRLGLDGAWHSIAAGIIVALVSPTLLELCRWALDPLPNGVPATAYYWRWRDAAALATAPGAAAGWVFHLTGRRSPPGE